MDEIIVAALIALLAGFALFDVIRFVQSFERVAIWKFLLGIGLPCAVVAYLVIGFDLLDGTLNAAPFMRDAAAMVRP
ncbi:hypothetical protein [Microvirga sp. P5_D2]|jgi:hypothetical protein